MRTVLESLPGGSWTVRRYDDAGGLVEEVSRAIPVSELCRRLGKSRRQVYRYLTQGWLQSSGKYLGEWLVREQGIEWLARGARVRFRPIPRSAQTLFPEYRLARLHPFHDGSLIIPRIMEQGGREELMWMMRQYDSRALRRWLAAEGWKLTPRAARFWSWWFRVPPPPPRRLPAAGGKA
ncbi:MAG: hypothetical protein AAB152_18610 [Candidatus Coatesbacteria bacterium]